MYTLILSRCSDKTLLIQNLLSKANCRFKVASVLSTLEREIRLEFPDFLLIDQNFFCNDQENKNKTQAQYPFQIHSDFTDLVFPVNKLFPMFLFDSNQSGFTQYHASEYHKAISIPSNEIILLLTQIRNNINSFIQSSKNQFRPVEKKLYLLLKDNQNQAISLIQMAEELWGCATSAHTKTLYSYIHRIKHILEQNEFSPEWLIKEKKGYYKLEIGKRE